MTDDNPTLNDLMRDTGLRVFLDAPDGPEVWKPGGEKPLYTAKNKPQAVAYLQGWRDGNESGKAEREL